MKKTLLFAAVAIGMAACTNETDVITQEQPREVSFKTAAKNATRAAVTTPRVPTDATIYVSAFQKDGETYESYFSNIPFTYPNTDTNSEDQGQGAWTGGVFWPKSGTLDFMAYCCGKEDEVIPNATLNADVAHKRIQSLELDYTTSALAGKTDVMWSDMALTKNATFSLSFNHALAWVMVNFVHAGSNTDNDAIKLRKIQLNNVSLTGKLTVTPTYTDNSITYSADWTNPSTRTNVFFPAFADANGESKEIIFTAAADTYAKGLMIIPGKQTSITFEYCTKNGTAADGITPTYTNWHTYEIKLNETNDDNIKWVAGKKYTYQISVSTTSIAFTTEVKGWEATTVDKTLN